MLLFTLLATHVERLLWDVVAVLFVILDQVKEHGVVLSKPCTSKECSWNKDKDYDLADPFTLRDKVILRDNLTPSKLMEIPGTQGQSTSEQWFSERWCRLTASKCFPTFKVGKLIVEAEPNAASEAHKFISRDIWGIDVMPFQSTSG